MNNIFLHDWARVVELLRLTHEKDKKICEIQREKDEIFMRIEQAMDELLTKKGGM